MVYDETDLEIVRAAAELVAVRRRRHATCASSGPPPTARRPARAAAGAGAALAQPGAAQGGDREPREPRGAVSHLKHLLLVRDLRRLSRRIDRAASCARVTRQPPRSRAPHRRTVWELVSDPHNLPRWWPRTSGSRTSTQAGAASAAQWTKVLGTAAARACGPTTAASARARRERYVWEQELEGTPFERHPALLEARDRLRGDGRRDRGQRSLRAAAARALAAGLADDARRPGQAPRRGPGRDRAGAGSGARNDSRRGETRSGGAGATRQRSPSWTPRRVATLRERVGRAGRARHACWRSRSVRVCRDARAAACSARRGGRRRRRLHLDRGPRAPRGRPRLSRPGAAARGRLDAAPDAVLLPGRRRRGRAGARGLRGARASAVVPFGGGTSVVGGVEPLRGALERLVALDLGAAAGRRGRPPLADRPARRRPAGPEAEAALGAEGVTLGHFPQSFEYATIGGFAATRSAGQASSGYGRFDELVTRCG